MCACVQGGGELWGWAVWVLCLYSTFLHFDLLNTMLSITGGFGVYSTGLHNFIHEMFERTCPFSYVYLHFSLFLLVSFWKLSVTI